MDPLVMLQPKTVAQAREAGWRDLAVECRHCSREVHVPWDRLPPQARLDRLGRRMRCLACGTRGAHAYPWMDEREYRRLQHLVRS